MADMIGLEPIQLTLTNGLANRFLTS